MPIDRLARGNCWQGLFDEARLSRGQTLTKFLLAHACSVVTDCDPKYVRISVGSYVFEDLRENYPSEKLIADVALAVYSGAGDIKVSPDDFTVGDFDPDDVARVISHGVYRDGNVSTFYGVRVP